MAGKGGAGKTTLSATLSRLAARAGAAVVAIDADANPNLSAALGITPENAAGLRPVPASLVSRRIGGAGLTEPVDDVLGRCSLTAPDGVRLMGMGAPAPTKGACAPRMPSSPPCWRTWSHLSAWWWSTWKPPPSTLSRGTVRHVDAIALVAEQPYYRSLEPIGSLPLRGYIPMIIGLSYIAAGLLGGRGGLLLGPGIVLTAWGVAPMTVNYAEEFGGMFYLCLGTGLVIAAFLAERAWHRITPMSLAIPVLFIGFIMFVAPYVAPNLTFVVAALLVGWGLFELRPQKENRTADAHA